MDMASPSRVWRWLDREGGHPPAEAISDAAFALITARLRLRRRAALVRGLTAAALLAAAIVLISAVPDDQRLAGIVGVSWLALLALACVEFGVQAHVRRRDDALPARVAATRSVRAALVFLGPVRVPLLLLVLVAPLGAAFGFAMVVHPHRPALLVAVPAAIVLSVVSAIGVWRSMRAPIVAIDSVTVRVDDSFRSSDLYDLGAFAVFATMAVSLLAQYEGAHEYALATLAGSAVQLLVTSIRQAGVVRLRRVVA